jgi:hypothetical protein
MPNSNECHHISDNFITFADLYNPSSGYIINDIIHFDVKIDILPSVLATNQISPPPTPPLIQPKIFAKIEGFFGDYVGEVNEANQKHGSGVFVWKKGKEDKGEYFSLLLIKNCPLLSLNYYLCLGNKYTGQWRDNEMHGDGKMEYKNGDVYEGNLIRILLHHLSVFIN